MHLDTPGEISINAVIMYGKKFSTSFTVIFCLRPESTPLCKELARLVHISLLIIVFRGCHDLLHHLQLHKLEGNWETHVRGIYFGRP